MGVVYAARDPYLDRKIAIKVLRATPDAGAGARTRLVNEARAIARLTHPNVIAIHDVGFERDQLYLAMEQVEGLTLDRWLAAAPRSPAEVIALCLHESVRDPLARHAGNLRGARARRPTSSSGSCSGACATWRDDSLPGERKVRHRSRT
jgi:serine/threonine protein kinase